MYLKLFREAAKEMEEFLAKKEAEKLAAKQKNANPFKTAVPDDEACLDTGMLNALYPNLTKGLGPKNGKKKSNIIHPYLVDILIIKCKVKIII